MQRKEIEIEIKTIKTLELLGALNLIMSPLLLVDLKFGVGAMIILNGLVLNYLHNLGLSRRPASNLMVRTYSMFAPHLRTESLEINNGLRNIVNGGAAVFDELVLSFGRASSNPRR
jgi:hypothetical protein